MRTSYYATLYSVAIYSVAILAAGLAAAPAFAAPDPSVSDVVKALTISPNGTSRGSRPVVAPSAASPTAASSATHTATPPPPPMAEGSGAIDLSVQFASGKADLTTDARHTLDILGQALTTPQLAAARIRIEGHTDTTGTRDANLALSWQRATTAVTYLQERFRIPAGRLEAVGKGQDDPLIRTAENVNEPRNRRVHVVNLSQ